MPKIEFWYEFASTYCYPTAMRIEKVAKRKGVAVVWKPFLLGPVFKDQGMDDSPFNLYPIKGGYMWRDLERICEQQGIKFRRPKVFPQNGLLAARVALTPTLEGKQEKYSRQVYKAQFAKGKDISSAEVLATILSRIGVNAEHAFEQAEDDKIKTSLRKNTEKAMKKKVFGAPTFITTDGELFWGNDRLEQAVTWARKHRKR